jgi:glycosyltransferase involved in cell wall biosynthesis
LFIHSSDELYGSDVVLLELIKRLDRASFTPIVVLPSDITYEGKLSRALDKLAVQHYRVRMGVLRRRYFHPFRFHQLVTQTLTGSKSIDQIIQQHHIGLIHSNTSAVLNGAIAARKRRLPHVWHVHEILAKPSWLGKIIYRLIHATSDAIVTISHAVADHMKARLPHNANNKIQVIWDGTDCERFHPAPINRALRTQWQVGDDDVLFAVVGRISHWKGQTLALSALAQAIAAQPAAKLKLMIVGSPVPGEEYRTDQLSQLARELGIHERVVFVSFHSDVPSIMQAIDVLILPSLLPEPLGLVVLEAMATAKPVIASRHGGPLETIIDQETGLHFTPDDAQSLSNAMLKLSNNAALRTQMGHSGRQRVLEFFSLERFAQAFSELYKKAVTHTHENRPPRHARRSGQL